MRTLLSALVLPQPSTPRRGVAVVSILAIGAVSALTLGPTPAVSLDPSSGALHLKPGRSATATLPVSFTNGGTAASFIVPPAARRPVYLAVVLRGTGAASGYRSKIGIRPNGSWTTSLSRVAAGRETVLWTKSQPGRLSSGQAMSVQEAVSGTNPVTVKTRAWRTGSTKPGWQHVQTDASGSRVKAGGPARLWGYQSSDSTGSSSQGYRSFAAWPATTSGPVQRPSAGSKPSTGSTGVPSGTKLKVHNGDLKITKAGTTISGLDVHGFITVQAANVTIKKSIVRGGVAKYNRGEITDYGYKNLLVEDVDILPSHQTVYQDGVKGSDFHLNRVYIKGNVDSVKVHGDGNVRVEHSVLENTTMFAHDPNQGGGRTHNDGVQILEGKNITIYANTIRGQQNFPILGAADRSNASNVTVKDNWLDGGHCTSKFQEDRGHNLQVTVTGNRFGPHRAVKNCELVATRGSSVSASHNTMESNGAAVGITWTDS